MKRALAELGVAVNTPSAISAMPTPVRAVPLLRNANCPFWLLVLPGIGVDVDLVEVVLARVLDHDAALERVAAVDPGRRVDTVWIGPLRRGRIRTAVDAR